MRCLEQALWHVRRMDTAVFKRERGFIRRYRRNLGQYVVGSSYGTFRYPGVKDVASLREI